MIDNKRFLKSLVGFSLGIWVTYMISFISAPIITRMFSPEEYGKISMFMTYAALLTSVSLIGMDQVFVRFYYDTPSGKTKNYLLTYCLLIGVTITCIIGLLLQIADDYVSQMIVGVSDPQVASWLFLYILAAVIYRYITLLYRVETNVKDFTIVTILNAICLRGVYIFAGIINPTFDLVVSFMAITSFLLSVVYLCRIRKKIDKKFSIPDSNFIIETGKFALPIVPVAILTWVNNSMALIILNKYSTFEEVGIYTAATALAATITIVKAGFDSYWSPYVFENYKDDNNNFWTIHKFIAIGLVFFSILIILFQEPISKLLGPDFRAAMQFFPFLLINPICYTLAETTSVGIGISKKSHLNIYVTLVSVIVNFIFCLILVPKFGGSGAALASGIASVAYLVTKTLLGERYYKSVKSYFYIIVVVVALFTLSFINYYFYALGIPPYVAIFIVAAILAIIFYRELVTILREAKGFRKR